MTRQRPVDAAPDAASDPARTANGSTDDPRRPTAPQQTDGAAEPAGTALYRVAPWVLVRTPLLPVSALGAVRDPLSAIRDPEVVRALAIGSPTLLDKALQTDRNPKEEARTRSSLARYLIRMSTRPTPYGAFAAVSLAGWASGTELCLGAERRTRTRPDMGWLRALLAELESRADVRARLRWRADPLVVETGDRLVAPAGGSVRATEPARMALAAAEAWIGYATLVDQVCAESGGTTEQVAGLIDQLRSAGLLCSDLAPALTGAAATSGADAAASAMRADPGLADAFDALFEAIRLADSAKDPDASFERVRVSAREILAHEAETFQTDLARDLSARSLTAAIGDECARAVEVMLRIGPGPSATGDLAGYAKRFAARWGLGAEVPLVRVFDPEHGLGPLPHTHGGGSMLDAAAAARRAETLSALALEALHEDRRSVQLDAATIAALAGWPTGAGTRPLTPATASDAPLSLDVSVFLLAADPRAIDAGDFTLVIGPNLGAPLAGRWLGRFADLFGAEADAYYAWLDEAERAAAPGTVPAEVVYLPANPRSTNVILRPRVATYEIVVTGRGSAPHQVGLRDLVIGHHGTGLYVRSRSLGVRLRPTARHMLNHHGAPPVCQFLDAVGHGSAAEFNGFDWGASESLPVLPRVQVGRTVLAPARWLVSVPGWTPADGVTRAALAEALNRAQQRWGLPDRVYASVADNRLLLDLTEPDDRDQLHREFKTSGGTMRLQEALPDVADAWVPGPDGHYLTELVISLVRRPGGTLQPSESTAPTGGSTDEAVAPVAGSGGERARLARPSVRDRVRLPGSDWLFAKFYAPYDQLTRLLSVELADLIDMAQNSGLARCWFFLRYSDPEPHLRVRWQGEPDLLLRHLLPQVSVFAEQLVEAGRISRLAIDSYDRELDRYGGPAGLDVCESVFHADSVACRQLLSLTGVDLTEVTVASTVQFLAGLGLEAERRVAFYESQAALVQDAQVGRAAGDDYRVRKTRLRALVAAQDGPVVDVLRSLRSELAQPAAALNELAGAGGLDGTVDELLPSLVHMHHNRMVGPGQPSEPHLIQLALRTERGMLLSGPHQR